MIQITLPWPDDALSPNGRANRYAKARKVAVARQYAAMMVRQAIGPGKLGWNAAQVAWTFHTKTKRIPDDDNLAGWMKAYRDGIADALQVNDRDFKTTYSIAQPIKGGAVIVHIEEG